MSDQEMKDIWFSSKGVDKINIEPTQLMNSLNQKMKKLDRTLFFRDFREIIAAIIVMGIYGYKAMFENVMVQKATSILIVLWAIYVIYRLVDVKKFKKRIDISQSFKNQLLQQRTYLQQQSHLLNNILSWYVGPFAIILTIRIVGKSFGDPLLTQLYSYGISLGVLYLLCWGLYVLNKRAAMKTYVPLIEKIDEVLVGLEEK